MSGLERNPNVPHSEHVEVTLDDLFIEHYEPPAAPPKVSAAMKGARRRVPHHRSLLGLLLLGGLIVGAGILSYKRWIA